MRIILLIALSRKLIKTKQIVCWQPNVVYKTPFSHNLYLDYFGYLLYISCIFFSLCNLRYVFYLESTKLINYIFIIFSRYNASTLFPPFLGFSLSGHSVTQGIKHGYFYPSVLCAIKPVNNQHKRFAPIRHKRLARELLKAREQSAGLIGYTYNCLEVRQFSHSCFGLVFKKSQLSLEGYFGNYGLAFVWCHTD